MPEGGQLCYEVSLFLVKKNKFIRKDNEIQKKRDVLMAKQNRMIPFEERGEWKMNATGGQGNIFNSVKTNALAYQGLQFAPTYMQSRGF